MNTTPEDERDYNDGATPVWMMCGILLIIAVAAFAVVKFAN